MTTSYDADDAERRQPPENVIEKVVAGNGKIANVMLKTPFRWLPALADLSDPN